MFNIKSLRNTRVFQEGREEGMLEIIPKLVAAGLSPEKIAEVTALPLDQVRTVLESQMGIKQQQALEDLSESF